MALIDLTNFATTLVQSTQGRGGTPDGNIFFDVANGLFEIIPVEELATVDLSGVGGGASDPNPISQQDGILKAAVYAFEKQERIIDETLRQYNKYFDASYKFAGAYEIINSRKFSSDADRDIIRGSGWIERAIDGGVDRIYFGGRSLGNVESGSQPYYLLVALAAPSDYAKTGAVDEAVQVFGSTGNSPTDASAGDFDTRTTYEMYLRTYGQTYDQKGLLDSGLSQTDGYASGFAVNEGPHLTTVPATYPLADVYTSPIAPFDGMTLEKLAVAQTESGFNEADGDFTWVLHNTGNGTLDQCVAFLDALAQTDDDIDTGAITTTNGKRVGTWYYYNSAGQIITRSGADALGLYIENIPTADEQRIQFTDDAAALKTRPFLVQVEVEVGALAVADGNAWYHCFFTDGPGAGDDFNTAGALTVLDAGASAVKGNVNTDASGTKIIFTFDYDGDTLGGTAGTTKNVTFECEGEGGVTAALTEFDITRNTTVSATCSPGLETNV